MKQPETASECGVFWSLYVANEEDVVLCETQEDAIHLKTAWSRSVHVSGPFEHPRHELPLIQTAFEASVRIDNMLSKANIEDRTREELASINRELKKAIKQVYPFDLLPLHGGHLANLNS